LNILEGKKQQPSPFIKTETEQKRQQNNELRVTTEVMMKLDKRWNMNYEKLVEFKRTNGPLSRATTARARQVSRELGCEAAELSY
jgi:hypothetical protein